MLRIDSGFIILDTKVTSETKKKMSGHSFVAYAGFDKWNKRGDVLLQNLGYFKPDFDEKYRYRGDMAEKMVKFILDKQGKKYIYHDEEDKKKNNYDFFPEYKYCGGIPDFELDDEIWEIKSKSLKDYDKICKELPIEEQKQGEYYTYLRKKTKLVMVYVFFDEESEKLLFENKMPKTLDNCKIMLKRIEINPAQVYQEIGNALIFQNVCLDNKAIPLDDVSPKVLKILRDKGLFDTGGF